MLYTFIVFVVAVFWFACAHSAIVSRNSYQFSYTIDVGPVVSQHSEEGRNNMVRGSYSFLQPDGKVRSVWYRADKNNGFEALVKYRDIRHGAMKGPLKFPRDFQHPVILEKPVSIITKGLLQGTTDALGHKKHAKS